MPARRSAAAAVTTPPPPPPSARAAAAAPDSSSSASSARRGREADSESDANLLFESMLAAGAALDLLADDYVQRAATQRSAVLGELVTLLCRAAGCQRTVRAADIERHDTVGVLTDLVLSMPVGASEFPFAAKSTKQFPRFRRNLLDFVDRFVVRAARAECELSTRRSGGGDDDESGMLEVLFEWMATMSSAQVRAFREVGTSLSYAALLSCAKLAQAARSDVDSATQTSRKRSNTAVSAHQVEQRAMLEFAEEKSEFLFTSVFTHRHRDTFADIRLESLGALESWIAAYPHQFLNSRMLRYFAWLLNDASEHVREKSVAMLIRLYKREAFLPTLMPVTARFLDRFLELCNDASPLVAARAFELCDLLATAKLLDASRMRPLATVMWDRIHPIRHAAGALIAHHFLAHDRVHDNLTALASFILEFHEQHDEFLTTALFVESVAPHCAWLRDWPQLVHVLLQDRGAEQIAAEHLNVALGALVASALLAAGRLAAPDVRLGVAARTSRNAQDEFERQRGELTGHLARPLVKLMQRHSASASHVATLSMVLEALDLEQLQGATGRKIVHDYVRLMVEALAKCASAVDASYLAKSLHVLARGEFEWHDEVAPPLTRLAAQLAGAVAEALTQYAPAAAPAASRGGRGRKGASGTTPSGDQSELAQRVLAALHRLVAVTRWHNVCDFAIIDSLSRLLEINVASRGTQLSDEAVAELATVGVNVLGWHAPAPTTADGAAAAPAAAPAPAATSPAPAPAATSISAFVAERDVFFAALIQQVGSESISLTQRCAVFPSVHAAITLFCQPTTPHDVRVPLDAGTVDALRRLIRDIVTGPLAELEALDEAVAADADADDEAESDARFERDAAVLRAKPLLFTVVRAILELTVAVNTMPHGVELELASEFLSLYLVKHAAFHALIKQWWASFRGLEGAAESQVLLGAVKFTLDNGLVGATDHSAEAHLEQAKSLASKLALTLMNQNASRETLRNVLDRGVLLARDASAPALLSALVPFALRLLPEDQRLFDSFLDRFELPDDAQPHVSALRDVLSRRSGDATTPARGARTPAKKRVSGVARQLEWAGDDASDIEEANASGGDDDDGDDDTSVAGLRRRRQPAKASPAPAPSSGTRRSSRAVAAKPASASLMSELEEEADGGWIQAPRRQQRRGVIA